MWHQYLVDSLLHQSVYYRRYSYLAFLAIVFRYLYPPTGLGRYEPSSKELISNSLLAKSHGSICSHDILLIPPHPLFRITHLYARLRFSGLRICSNKCSLSNGTSTMLFMYPHESLRSLIPFSFRPIYPRVAIRLQPLQPSHVSKPF